jgi:hypothetical protein
VVYLCDVLADPPAGAVYDLGALLAAVGGPRGIGDVLVWSGRCLVVIRAAASGGGAVQAFPALVEVWQLAAPPAGPGG